MIDNHSLSWDKEALRSLRLRLGWSRSDLARHLHCSSEQVELMEDGTRQIDTSLRGQLELILRQAEACCDEVKFTPVAENECDKKALEQIDFSRVRAELE
ncbi:helix-turn-helix transcriptional regulator [Bdellovibrio sp. 22V]|uniref:helix-turn-helix domain-containing protein n=1 Tax=Bdellovibrio TaxID=958 RepID=UPI00254318B0|nr:helix-turn-helix transcriptional regulator [Bdellovibrio sp. 22V]WII73474.1 helix-turn-helix transcriptional regulator [Bdellovibrio sp. 22V]